MSRPKTLTFALVTVLAITVWPMLTGSLRAQEINETRALEVKAAYLYHFAKFITWPRGTFADDETPFVIGVLGRDPLGSILEEMVRTKNVAGHRIKIQRFDHNSLRNLASLQRCQILFIGATAPYRIDDVLVSLEGLPVLVVSDLPRFARRGGMIGLVLEKGRILFEINRQALSRAELKPSSKLLKLARIVKPMGGGPFDSQRAERHGP